MKEDKIEIMAQPDTPEKEGEVRDSTIKKLQELVEKDVMNEKGGLEETKEKENDGINENAGFDQDGFEIPVGKIPLDGQFSAQEVRELIQLSKEEGYLKDDVEARVSQSNSISKHIEIVEPRSETA